MDVERGRSRKWKSAHFAFFVLHAVCLFTIASSFGRVATVKLNGPMAAGGNVDTYQIGTNGQWVVCKADQDTNNVGELYSVPIRPVGASRRLNVPLTLGRFVRNGYEINPVGTRVVDRADQEVEEVVDLYSVPIEGPEGSGVKLNDTLVAGGGVGDFAVSSYDDSVVYRADLVTDDVSELYSVPLLGPPAARILLNRSLGADGDVTYFKLSPDGSQVVYRADRIRLFFGDDVFGPWTAPVSGPAGSSTIYGLPPVDGGDVHGILYLLSPDNRHVVYIADQDPDNLNEL